jgi:D-amino-acid dehydrogenase
VKGIINSLAAYYDGLDVIPTGKVWYGYRPCAPDGMPYIGCVAHGSSIIAATGHAMMGLSLGPATGRMVRDLLVSNIQPPVILQPGRFRLRSR